MSELGDKHMPYESIFIDASLSLRQLQINEARELFDLTDHNREYLRKWLPWVDETKSPEDSEQFITDTLRKRQEGSEYGFGIVANGKVIGHISLMHLSDDEDPEIGYWIASDQSGKGITTRAAKALTDFGLQTLHLDKIVIKADTNNVASNKIAEKLGYTLEGTINDAENQNTTNVWSINKATI
jgi:ribosomal-protein-serine acetyltransferase